MWLINRPKRKLLTSKNFYTKAPDQPLKFHFQIRDCCNGVVARGRCSDWMDPAPLWEAGLRLGGDAIWYMNPSSFLYERFTPHRERSL